jgi:mitofusin 2
MPFPNSIHETDFFKKRETTSKLIQELQEIILMLLNENSGGRFSLSYPFFGDQNNSKFDDRISKRSKTFKEQNSLSILQIFNHAPNVTKHEYSSWINSIDEISASKLLTGKLNESLDFLSRLHSRICDIHSRVLVTGDVNAGKSTFINNLLDIPYLPVDQQPCTQSFVEVTRYNRSKSKEILIHSIKDITEYNIDDISSYRSVSLADFCNLVQENPQEFPWFRIYLNTGIANDDLLSSTSFIDSPGLNSDSYKTMALFAQQEDIDVVIFILNAANHLTLSAKDFLEAAGLDKSDNIFIIVNRFDDITNKEKCKRNIVNQVQEIFPEKDCSSFLYFFSSQGISNNLQLSDSDNNFKFITNLSSFKEVLFSFLINKKTKTKLQPAFNYMSSIISDASYLLDFNINYLKFESSKVLQELEIIKPVFEDLTKLESQLLHEMDKINLNCCNKVYSETKLSLSNFITNIEKYMNSISWFGIYKVWSFRRELVTSVGASLKKIFDECKEKSLFLTLASLKEMNERAVLKFDHSIPYSEKVNLSTELDLPLIELGQWDLIDLKSEANNYKTLLGASFSATAMLSYQTVFSVFPRIFNLFSNSNFTKFFCVVTLGSSVFFLCYFLDFERMVKRKLLSILLTKYDYNWVHESARKLENDCHLIVSNYQSYLVNTFYEILSQKRKLKTEKDLLLAQLKAKHDFFTCINKKLESLRGNVSIISL